MSKLSEIFHTLNENDTPYQQHFRRLLAKHGYSSPADIPEEKKKAFFTMVDRSWHAKDEDHTINKPAQWEIFDLIHNHMAGLIPEDEAVQGIAGHILANDMSCREIEDMLGHFKIHCTSQDMLNKHPGLGESVIDEVHHRPGAHHHHHYPRRRHSKHFSGHAHFAAATHVVHHHRRHH